MKNFIFIVGGARSGKSKYAIEIAKKISKKVAFIATATCSDKEMEKRIKSHKNSRPKYWDTIEAPINIESFLPELENKYDVVIIDCIGLLVSNLMEINFKNKEIEKNIINLIKKFQNNNFITIIVSNEVGGGIVPENALARRFRDIIGTINQAIAKHANEVFSMQVGIPMKIK